MNAKPSTPSIDADAERILVFLPMYNCENQIIRVLRRLCDPLTTRHFAGLICVDNRSTDGTLEAATGALDHVAVAHRAALRNDENYGLGGSHKVAINYAKQFGFDYLLVLHGDDQGSVDDILPLLDAGAHRQTDCLLGARFMPGSKLEGYSVLRTSANHVFNILFSMVARRRLYDLGSGLNLFRVAAFDNRFHWSYPDNLTFNYMLILGICRLRLKYRFFPIVWREDDQVSNAKLFKQGLTMLAMLWNMATRPTPYMVEEHRTVSRDAYPATVVADWSGAGGRSA